MFVVRKTAAMVGVVLGAMSFGVSADIVPPTTMPAAAKFPAQGDLSFVGVNDIQSYQALDSYSEPEWVTKNFVETGKLPPVAERLPKEPLVFKTADMPNGVGEYGGTLRHVIGGRPEGWNWISGQSQGWGGISYTMWECLTRTGPLYHVKSDELEPLPNLAKHWEWSEDGKTLTMHLIEGAKWSDGDAFDTEDMMFWWNDHVLDTNISPMGGEGPDSFGEGTTLEAVDAYTLKWTFQKAFPKAYLWDMAFGRACPGPSHIMKPKHPAHGSGLTYDEYKNAFPPTMLNFPTMGAYVPTEYRPDDVVVMRRNPYYWKVDEAGNQLPYIDETQYKLSTWGDRTVQALAGSGDWSNMEQPEEFVEALKKSAEDDSAFRLEFGPRLIGYNVLMNFSNQGWGNPSDESNAVRDLNRNLHFRQAVTQGLDRARLGNSLVKGPFTAPYAGGLFPETSYFDANSTTFHPFDVNSAKAHLAAAGLQDSDGDGFVNYPADTMGGKNVEIAMLVNGDYGTDRNLAEGVVQMMEQIGLRVVPDFADTNRTDSLRAAGTYDWTVRRADKELISVVQNTPSLAATGEQTLPWHMAGPNGAMDLLPFEQELVDTVNAFIASNDLAEKSSLMKQYQKVYTDNVYSVGLVTYPGALIVNKRIKNVASGTPILLYQWAEDSAIRERMYVSKADQQSLELQPNTLPGL